MEFLESFGAFFEAVPYDMCWALDHGLHKQAPGPHSEAMIVAKAVDKRKREFRAGRNVAREALRGLGCRCQSLPRSASGAPEWPVGTCGSISHCDTLAVAVASKNLRGIGVDVEPLQVLSRGVKDLVLTEADRAFLADPFWSLRVFCAKEAFYKAWSAKLDYVPDFKEAAIVQLSATKFQLKPVSAALSDALGGEIVHGHLGFVPDYCIACVARS